MKRCGRMAAIVAVIGNLIQATQPSHSGSLVPESTSAVAAAPVARASALCEAFSGTHLAQLRVVSRAYWRQPAIVSTFVFGLPVERQPRAPVTAGVGCERMLAGSLSSRAPPHSLLS